MVHARYRLRGGEDQSFDTEAAMLEERGCEVQRFIVDNAHIDDTRPGLLLAADAIWSRSARTEIKAAIRRCRPDVVHVHNTFPRLSPSIYSAIRAEGVPVVQTLHNFRSLCLNGLLFRDGSPCEDCVGHSFQMPGIVRRCYRDSYAISAAVAAMNLVHQALATYRKHVSLFLACSDFARQRFIVGGLPAERIVVKPNTARDPGNEAASWSRPRSGAVFIGRLSPEKGISNLMQAWRGVGHRLTVVGDGPLAAQLREQASDEVVFTGWRSREEISSILSNAALLCLPSICYEQWPLAAGEAMSHGVPVLASDLGALPEIVQSGKTGLLLAPDHVEAWRSEASALLASPQRLAEMGRAARNDYLNRLSPNRVMGQLIGHYQSVLRGAL